jgi:hypothetical protein
MFRSSPSQIRRRHQHLLLVGFGSSRVTCPPIIVRDHHYWGKNSPPLNSLSTRGMALLRRFDRSAYRELVNHYKNRTMGRNMIIVRQIVAPQ